MSEPQETPDVQRAALAATFGRDLDPLAEYAATFEQAAVNPFALFEADVLATQDLGDRTLTAYERTFTQWQAFMDDQGRHPACPSEAHVKTFARHELETKGNCAATVRNKFQHLNNAYQYWQDDPAFPHPQDYNPFQLAKSKLNLDGEPTKEPPRLPLTKLTDIVEGVTHIRDRAIIATQLKLGLRATELCNIRLAELSIANSELQRHYPSLGTHPMVEERSNAVYIPSNDEREGNKSKRPRVLPLDDELRHVLLRWLLIRPDTGAPWLLLSANTYSQMDREHISRIWREVFHPKYAETDQHSGVTSHFGRHYFSTYWRKEQDLNRELLKYLRGDVTASDAPSSSEAVDTYLHTYYEDIEDQYREHVFKLGI